MLPRSLPAMLPRKMDGRYDTCHDQDGQCPVAEVQMYIATVAERQPFGARMLTLKRQARLNQMIGATSAQRRVGMVKQAGGKVGETYEASISGGLGELDPSRHVERIGERWRTWRPMSAAAAASQEQNCSAAGAR